jgi:hypothetical protein
MRLSPAHKELIKLLAEVAVEEFLEEQNSRARTMTPTRQTERNDDGKLTPIPSE